MVRSLVLPPRYAEELSPRHFRSLAWIHVMFTLLAIALDTAIYLALRGQPRVADESLLAFYLINVPAISAIGLLYASVLVSARARRPAVAVVAAVPLAGTILVWVQLTGSVTSYFMLALVLVILLYRLYVGYAIAAVFTGVTVAGHLLLVVLEQLGALRPESLFTGAPSQVYEVPAYQWLAITSITWVYLLAFLGANLVVNRLRQKDEAIAEIRAEMSRVARGVRHGRLTGSVLAEEYALGELLGRGGAGEVYAAQRLSDDQRLAVKVLHGHLLTSDTALRRFQREARLAQRLPPGTTAAVFDIGHDPDVDLHYLAMERLQGEDLAAYLRRRGLLGLPELLPIARRVAAALDAGHALGVLHRDLKPQNIFLLHRQGESHAPPAVRLLDFGMGKALGDGETTLTQDGAVLGTIAYMAPEQALGTPDAVGPAADRFSLAGVLYRCLTGRPPFQSGELVSAIHEILHVEPLPVSAFRQDLHPDVDAVLVLGLAKDPDLRPESAEALVSLLADAAEGRLSPEIRRRARELGATLEEGATLHAPAP